MSNPAQELIKFGQSVWYDNISRELLEKGELKRLVNEWGVRGVTSNPTIFDKAISSGSSYDKQIAELKTKKLTPDLVFEELALIDIAAAADVLLPVFQESKGEDGYVSIEVSPLLAANTQGTVEEGLRLFKRLNRPNIMVKVPGTKEGIPAVKALLEAGVNVNITLLFSAENYVEVAKTYVAALRERVKKNQPVDQIRSVASFFVSRVDTSVDSKLAEIEKSKPEQAALAKALRGKFGIANCKIAYKRYQEIFEGAEFADLKAKGAHVQRPLWASTGTKDPAYSDVMYVDTLIGPNTVNTMPHATLEAFVSHGKCGQTITQDVAGAEQTAQQLTDLGIDLSKVLLDLQIDGVKKFAESFQSLNAAIQKKL
ncbi:MAG: transaldolase [Bdellovibrionota bacterium]